jgi:hypothetical protein
MACLLFFVARIDDFASNTWLGREDPQERLEGQGKWAEYLFALFYSTGVFTGYSSEVSLNSCCCLFCLCSVHSRCSSGTSYIYPFPAKYCLDGGV